MTTRTISYPFSPGETLYACPDHSSSTYSLANWTTHRVQLVELAAPNTGLYQGSVDDAKGSLWWIFQGADQPSDWDEAVAVRDFTAESLAWTELEKEVIRSILGFTEAGTFPDPLSPTIVTPTEGVLAAIAGKTALIGTATATTPSPLSGTQLTIVAGDDYVTANGRAIVFTVTTAVTPASTQIGIQGLSPITGTAVDNGDTVTLTFELDAATTAQLTTCGLLDYTVQITDGSGNEFTVVTGRVRVLRKYT